MPNFAWQFVSAALLTQDIQTLRDCSIQFLRRREIIAVQQLRWGGRFEPPHEVDQGFKAALRQDFLQSSFGLCQAIVVAEPRLPTSFKARLLGIKFPGVEVNNYRVPIPSVDVLSGPTSKQQRKQSQI